MTNEEEREIAAALVVAIEAGLLSAPEAIRVVDREIARIPSPAGWLIEASLTTKPQDLLHVIRPAAEGHPLLGEVWPLLEAMERLLSRGVDPIKVGRLIERVYPLGSWPPELSQPLYELYEEVTCAHEHGGEPQPRAVVKALERLFEVGRIDRHHESVLERVLS